MYKDNKRYFWLLLALLTAFPFLYIHADGSRNWASPSTNTNSARRAFLRSSMLNSANWPFPNLGTHYVYAKEGERITVASSMQGVGANANKRIRLYSPTGDQITLDFTNGGRIVNRAEEVAGPRLSGVTSGGGYTPAYYLVPSGGDGVYRVEFISTYTGDNSQTGISGSINAASDWNQSHTTTNTVTIAAWDVSVINVDNSSFIPGRVYTNVLNLSNGTGDPNRTGFYGVVYARTKDGYTYRVNNNGNNGMYFTFFVNNNGFVDPETQEPVYKSLNYSNPVGTDLLQRVHNPNNADEGTHSTHKLFYTLPADDFPKDAPVAVTEDGGLNWTEGSTWLNATPQTPTITNVRLVGADETIGQVSSKGGYIEFEANLDGNFRLEISSGSIPAIFPSRTITGHAFAGQNRAFWDGKDGEGNEMPAGQAPLNVEVQLQGAEVHFPFFDMEYNRFGTIIELLDHTDNLNSVASDIVYWNDVDVDNGTTGNNSPRGRYSDPINNSHLPPANSSGTKSSDNGHIWGLGATGTSRQFGDEKSIDTWTFITGPKETEDIEVTVKIADLKITEVSTGGETNVSIGSGITYTVKVKNGETEDGGSDVEGAKFTFTLPEGFSGDLNATTFSGNSCGSESTQLSYNATTRTYTSSLDLPNGCEVVYTFTATVTSSATPGATSIAEATILRPRDVTDPNATNRSNRINPHAPVSDYPNPDPDTYYVSPFDAHYECANGPVNSTDPCNNILSTAITVNTNNYWMGGTSGMENEWSVSKNWTDNRVPLMGEDVEFATVDNYGTAAVEDLYLDDLNQNNSGGRIIGNMINNSDKNLIITTGNQLSIEGKVEEKVQQSDESYGAGTIVVKSTNIPTDASDPVNEPSGTLIVNPDENPNGVEAIVEFYNKAYDCADCGFYTRSWQYFSIPVEESGTPTATLPFTSAEEVNEWSEPTNGNKWITPDMPLTAFTGYQITRNEESEPTFTNAVHNFNGLLNLGDASVALTRTNNVNYSGMNLIGNSYTAAIPINGDAISFPTDVEQTVYLFNTGTRDQWRKLNGTAISQDGYRSGQYLAVPVNLGGTLHFPDRIPSMHSFMVLVESGTGGNLTIDYSKLVKNTTVALGDGSTQIVTRSATATENNKSASTSTIPSLVMDVIGEESADRVWIFAKEGTTHGFDNGWDGRKMTESGIAQLYVTGSDNSQLQVATVPTVENMLLGFEADVDGKYTIEFALSAHWTTEEIFLRDLATGANERVINGGSYTFQAEKGDSGTRFSLSASGIPMDNESAKIVVLATGDGKIAINNNSNLDCTIFISNTAGKLLQRLEVKAGSGQEVESLPLGSYVVRLQNAVVNDVRKVIVD